MKKNRVERAIDALLTVEQREPSGGSVLARQLAGAVNLAEMGINFLKSAQRSLNRGQTLDEDDLPTAVENFRFAAKEAEKVMRSPLMKRIKTFVVQEPRDDLEIPIG